MIALVTGASSGIGRDIAKELAKKGYDIIAVARNKEALENLKKEIDNVKVDIQILDVTNREGCIQLHDEMIKKYGFVDVVVNNAGFGTCGKFVDTDLNKEIKMIDTNITALHMLTKLFLIDMVKEDKGHIMNVASIAGFMPGPLMATYYSSICSKINTKHKTRIIYDEITCKNKCIMPRTSKNKFWQSSRCTIQFKRSKFTMGSKICCKQNV